MLAYKENALRHLQCRQHVRRPKSRAKTPLPALSIVQHARKMLPSMTMNAAYSVAGPCSTDAGFLDQRSDGE
ncbi:hypothetical protein SH528x_002501 [Novipirellula sp. SH528]|uniref:hypothetical protein n=1 Tax=Novipirellula sp. SH528 TaxID=3454466 RepID=UPI003FA11BAB